MGGAGSLRANQLPPPGRCRRSRRTSSRRFRSSGACAAERCGPARALGCSGYAHPAWRGLKTTTRRPSRRRSVAAEKASSWRCWSSSSRSIGTNWAADTMSTPRSAARASSGTGSLSSHPRRSRARGDPFGLALEASTHGDYPPPPVPSRAPPPQNSWSERCSARVSSLSRHDF